MAGKKQVIGKDSHGHKTKVHRRDLKVINSNAKVTEMYEELRKEGRRLGMGKRKKTEPQRTEQNSEKDTGRRTGLTL